MREIKFMAKHIYHITVAHAAVFKTQITTVVLVNYTHNIKRYMLNNLVINLTHNSNTFTHTYTHTHTHTHNHSLHF